MKRQTCAYHVKQQTLQSRAANPFAESVYFLNSGVLQQFEALGANQLALEKRNSVAVVTENARRLILLQNDAIFIHEDLQRISALNSHSIANFDRKNDSSQFVDLTNHAG